MGTGCVAAWTETMTAARALSALVSYEFAAAADSLRDLADNRGKTTRALIVSVAAAVEASGFYNDRLETFVCNESLIVEWAGKVEVHSEILDSEVVPSDATFKACNAVLKDLGTFLAALPMKMLSSFATPFEQKFVALASQVAHSPVDKVDRALALLASRSVSEGVSVFPTNMELAEVQSDLAALLVKLDSGERVDLALQAFRDELDLSDSAACVSCCARLGDALKNCAALDLSADLMTLVFKRAMEFVGFLAVHCGDLDKIDDLKKIADGVGVLAKRVHQPALTDALAIVTAGVNLADQFAIASRLPSEVSADPDSQANEVVTALKVRIQQVNELGKPEEMSDEKFHQAFAALDLLLKKCLDFAEKYDSQQLGCCKNALDKVFEDTVVITKGLIDGKAWHATVKNNDSFAKLAEVANETMGKLDPKRLDLQRTILMSGIDNYRKIMTSQGHDKVDDPYTQKAKRYADFLIITRCEINLIHILRGNLAGESLRNKVQPEILDLRAAGHKEKDVLHIALFSAANNALLLARKAKR